MKIIGLLFTLISLSFAFTELHIKEDGKDKTIYSASTGGASVYQDTTLTISHNGQSFMSHKDGQFHDPSIYYLPNYLGGGMEFDVDLSQVGCSCDAAMTLVSMPGYDSNGNYYPTDIGTYYCDGNQVGGNFCPEMDIMEANKYAFAVTVHGCHDPVNKHYDWCDKGGCAKHVWGVDSSAYGPGKRIDSNKWFTVKIDFNAQNDALHEVKVTLLQDQTQFTMSTFDSQCDHYEFKSMGDALKKGMGVAMSNWGGSHSDLAWLDGDTGCWGDCQGNPSFSINNLRIRTGGPSPGPGPDPPTPGQYSCDDGGCSKGSGSYSDIHSCISGCTSKYTPGSSCADPADDLCKNQCLSSACRWSWPSDDPQKWNSKDAKCRCFTH